MVDAGLALAPQVSARSLNARAIAAHLFTFGFLAIWELVSLIAPYVPEGKKGRPPFALETMLRIHFLQQWFTLSDPATRAYPASIND